MWISFKFIKFSFHRILLLFVFASTICLADESDENSQFGLSCASNYLKEKKLLDSKFRAKFAQSAEADSSCTEYISVFKDNVYETYDKEFRADKDLVEVADCLMEKLKEVELADLSIKNYVYESAVNMPRHKRKKAMKAIELAVEKKTETVVKVCTASKAFGDVFEELCEKDSSESDEDSLIDDFCIRKYLADNNFINTTIHQIDLNPQKVDVTGADCEKVIKESKEEVIDDLKKELEKEDEFSTRQSKKCLKKSVNESKYFEVIGKALVLCEVKMTPDIKEYERGQFAKNMGELYEFIYRC